MGINRGPNLIKDNLAYGYDTGYGVADPGLSTRFYKGKPTVNIASGDAYIHDTSSGGAGSVVDAPEKGPGWKKVTITAIGSNFRVIQFGSYPTMTANVLYASSFEADWGNLRGKGYVITQDGSGGGTRNYFKNGSYATGSTGNVAIDSTLLNGHIGMNIVKSATHVHVPFIYNSSSTNTSGRNDYFYYKEYQQEVGTIPTPYVNGTRSNTNSLTDLIKTTNIDVSNISFDSTGQPDFDGTDDYIDVNTNFGTVNAYTFEWVENPGQTHKMPIAGRTNTNFYKYGAYSWRYKHGGTLGEYYHTTGATSGWHHWVVTYDGSTIKVFQDNISLGTNSSSSGTADFSDGFKVGYWSAGGAYAFNGDIPVMKFYKRALTAEEIKNNFNAYKNRFNI